MSSTLAAAAALMGLAGAPHCAAMCGAPCMALARRCGGDRPWTAWSAQQGGRLLSYAAAGALVASGGGWLAEGARAAAWLRPLWLLLPLTALVLGLWLLATGRPLRWRRLEAAPAPAAIVHGPAPRRPVAALARAAGTGLLWVGWPCGLLYSALVVAALADGPAHGAAVMAVFAVAGLPALGAGPLLWGALVRRELVRGAALRTAGGLLVAASGWGLWMQLTAPGGPWCAAA